MQEIHIGNTGRMFAIQSPEGVEKYYFKPAESKDKVAKLIVHIFKKQHIMCKEL